MLRYVDFHCHVDLYPDPAAVIAETDAAGVGDHRKADFSEHMPEEKQVD